MSTLVAFSAMVMHRMRANWRLLAVVAFGVLVAAVLMASATIYTRSIAELGLGVSLRQETGDSGPVIAALDGLPLGSDRSADVRAYVEGSVDQRFADLSAGRVRSTRLPPFAIDLPAFADRLLPISGFLTSISGYESEVTVSGRLPRDAVLATDASTGLARLTGPIEVAVPTAFAAATGIAVGDSLPLVDRYDECDREPPPPPGAPPPLVEPCTPTASVQLSISTVVVGLIDQREPGAPLWTAAPFSFSGRGQSVPFVVSDATMFGSLTQSLAPYLSATTWVDQLDVASFRATDLGATQAAFDALRADLGSVGGFVRSPLEATLDDFETELNFSEVPILLLLIQVIGIVIFFVIIVASMLVEREQTEIALLRSRGASLRQVLSVYLGEGLLIGLIAVIVAPFIAAFVIGLLGHTGPFQAITDGRSIDTTLTASAWALAAVGAVFAIFAILVPAAAVSRLRSAEQRQRAARPNEPNVLQRYYLDIAFVVIAAGLIAEASQRGSVFERDAVGGLSSDPLLLLTPALFALAFVVVLLRALPYLLRAITWLIRDHVALPIAAALQQTVRNPGPSTRLMMLLMLGAALGTFAASYGGTVERSFDERTRYAAGVDLRASAENLRAQPPNRVAATLADVPGVEFVAPVLRRRVAAGPRSASSLSIDLLALNPSAARNMLWFPDAQNAASLDDLMREISATNVGPGIRLPDDPATLQLWLNPRVEREDLAVWMHLRDGTGRFFSLRLGTLGPPGAWRLLSLEVADTIADRRLLPPFSLHTIFMTEAVGATVREPGSVLFDDFSVTTVSGEETLLEDFEGARLGWERILFRSDRVDEIERIESEEAHTGVGALEFTISLGASAGRRGFFVRDAVLCPSGNDCRAPVIASSSFLETQGLAVFDTTAFRIGDLTVPIFIAGETEFFPTLDPANAGFLVANLDHLYYLGGIMEFDPILLANEVWLRAPSDPALRNAMIDTLSAIPYRLERFVDLPLLLEEQGSDPLTAAGGSGILLLSFIAVSVLIALAFLVTVYVTAQRRMLEMAVLRTLGISRAQMLGQLVLEYALIATIGLAAGTLLGTLIADLMLSFLEITELGDPVLPPFVVDTDWTVVAISYAALVAVFALGVLAAWRFFQRLPLNSVLRLGE